MSENSENHIDAVNQLQVMWLSISSLFDESCNARDHFNMIADACVRNGDNEEDIDNYRRLAHEKQHHADAYAVLMRTHSIFMRSHGDNL